MGEEGEEGGRKLVVCKGKKANKREGMREEKGMEGRRARMVLYRRNRTNGRKRRRRRRRNGKTSRELRE